MDFPNSAYQRLSQRRGPHDILHIVPLLGICAQENLQDKESNLSVEQLSSSVLPADGQASNKQNSESASVKETAKEPSTEEPIRRRTRRSGLAAIPPLTIDESAKDPKGKKRAVPGSTSDEDA
ncbi:hypothetical protein EV361DRAFT_956498 [Lentinula raphanica]|nr:hypothetical protein FB446DRAFT_800387 [Lentinula raphanica]KAJ3963901.1 hypothetical protein EV361DRAFT_956498 [Lentinula raphanica]